jgi:hypothetical protein
MRALDCGQLLNPGNPQKVNEVADVALVSASGLGASQASQPHGKRIDDIKILKLIEWSATNGTECFCIH